MIVFIRSNYFRKDLKQHFCSRVVTLPYPTNSSFVLRCSTTTNTTTSALPNTPPPEIIFQVEILYIFLVHQYEISQRR